MAHLEATAQDLRHAVRVYLKTPITTTIALTMLALGIGAVSSIFCIFNAILLEPLPYRDPERRVMIWSRWEAFDKTWVSEAEVLDYRRRASTLTAVAAWAPGQGNLTGDGEPIRVGVATVTANTFSVLGADPILGRVFSENEDVPGGPKVAVLGYGLWERRYGGDPSVLERVVQLDGDSFTIVGIMPPRFQLPTDFNVSAHEPTQIYVPLAIDENNLSRGSHGLYAAAELAPGETATSATAELGSITANLTREGLYPQAMQFSALAVPVGEEILGSVRPALLLLIGAVLFLLLIACANVASLLLAAAEGRYREIAVRSALGAGAARLVRQLLTEGLLLAVLAGGLGLGLSYAFARVAAAADPTVIPRSSQIVFEPRVVLFTAGIALATMVLFSGVPIFRSLAIDVAASLKEGSARSGSGSSRQGFHSALVVAEMALSVTLLIGAGLMLRSLQALQRIDTGFDPENVLTLRISLPEASYDTPEKVVTFYRRCLERVRGLPGVVEAGFVRALPLATQIGDWGLDVEGYVETPGNNAKGDWQVATDGAIEALGERLVRGRSIQSSDNEDSQLVAVVNESLAERYFGEAEPIGKQIRMGSDRRPWMTVVGVVVDVRHNGLTAVAKEKFYVPHSQFHRSTEFAPRTMTLAAKTSSDPLSVVDAIGLAVREIDPNLPLSAVRLMAEVVQDSIATTRYTGFLLGGLATVALLLAGTGIYGVLSHLVSQRQREIGIRMAMGATQGDVTRLFLGTGLIVSLAGVALGVGVAFALSRGLVSFLHGVKANDSVTYIWVPLVLLPVALGASYGPARRATRVNPVVSLRIE